MTDITDRARELLDGITPAAWELDDEDEDMIYVRAGTAITSPGVYNSTDLIHERDLDTFWDDEDTPSEDYHQVIRDARFIAAAPELVRELVAEVERLREQLDSRGKWNPEWGSPYDVMGDVL